MHFDSICAILLVLYFFFHILHSGVSAMLDAQ